MKYLNKKIKFFDFEEIHKELMKRTGYKKSQEDMELKYLLIRAIIKARGEKGLTQRELARQIKITQSALARFESGRTNPTLSFIQKIATGLGLKLTIM